MLAKNSTSNVHLDKITEIYIEQHAIIALLFRQLQFIGIHGLFKGIVHPKRNSCHHQHSFQTLRTFQNFLFCIPQKSLRVAN